MTRHRLDQATWPEVEKRIAAGPATLLVPLGATEQHGPHLPLGTDSVIAAVLAEAAAERSPNTVVAPLLPYGSSGEHQAFPGTLSIGAAAVELILVELGRSAAQTCERLVFVNAHGGNATPLTVATARLCAEGREARAWWPQWEGDAHAGRIETSLMLVLAPARVGSERGAGNTTDLADLMGELRVAGVRDVSPSGVLGDSRGANAAEGGALLASAVDDLCHLLAEWPVATGAAE